MLEKSLDLKQTKPIILPLAIIVFSLAYLSKMLNFDFLGNSFVNVTWLCGMIIPVILIIIGSVKKVGLKGKGDKNEQKN